MNRTTNDAQLIPHKARKRFGQNFLHDPAIINRIIRSIGPKSDDHLVEIGPGQGALTNQLQAGSGRLDVVELDRDLIPWLKLQFGLNENFAIHEADALQFDFATLRQTDEQLRIVGNLPYNISTPLIFHLLTYADIVKDMHFMLQKEVVERMAAQPGDKHYGRLGVMVQYFCQVHYLFPVGPGAFNPPPKVDSAIVRLTPYKELPCPCKNHGILEKVVKAAFAMRRKTLRNCLKSLISGDELEQLGIDPSLRPERIALESFVKIADYLTDRK
ncbi:16S rRNA (adenine(1518)-N(6)/adenine(1519)-N(6))-dimethyltransferase RsmA [Sansalvadorimonas sp. 2012CJ34-2]|uniref:Ribosomal RNA small subunit methyltransferase A n=1 Tax=Parendozoicomonas callyspongiae TaxID=2942213 RepID=A0ABT0PK87_9GAMM|nr:16S rRNA (adenine(1518)-N(6)/adenine(1519)-N(6))-dimethyltransferase RsmA [Sansalvadorimonas sp. 2012CJ34-2]MCL6271805.1 16S rRNA (adenine(1518)-N(6)/adenine(1519)-N(6))-dimethyltransferase RsmA [Sansalvadorimonas sp. 2012CJ34-2]